MELDMSSRLVHGRRYIAGLRFVRCVLNAVNLNSLSLSVFGGSIPRNCSISDKKDVNSLNAELNPICKFQLAELFCGVFKFCACFSKNLTKCLHTNMTQDAFHD